MKARPKKLIDALFKLEWFSSVGKKKSPKVVSMSSWEQAIESCCSLAWESACLEAQNRLSEAVYAKSPERHDEWNAIGKEITRATGALIRTQIKSVVRETKPGPTFAKVIRWNVALMCMNQEYSDLVQETFYSELAQWYLEGHFPCGWQGIFPRGKLIVF